MAAPDPVQPDIAAVAVTITMSVLADGKLMWFMVTRRYNSIYFNVDDHVFIVDTNMVEERLGYQQPTSNRKWSTLDLG